MMRLRGLPYKYLVATVFVSGLFMDILDTTIVNVALPTLGAQFHADNTTLEWVVTGLPAQSRGLDSRLRLVWRPVRHEKGLPLRAGDVHARLGALRLLATASAC